jgi:hypothetical protein
VNGHLSLEELRDEVARGSIDTVRVCFGDHYGMLRGRRLVGEVYVEDPGAPQAYCDGALVWDVHCDIFEETDYSNFRTGYPDLIAHPDLGSLRRCGWSEGSAMVLSRVTDPHGEPSPLDPRGLLGRVVKRAACGDLALSLSLRVGRGELRPAWAPGPAPEFAAMWAEGLEASAIPFESLDYDEDDGRAALSLCAMDPVAACDALVAARSCAREIGLVEGITVTTMGRLGEGDDERMGVEPAGGFTDDPRTLSRLGDLSLLCRPLPLGWPVESLAGGDGIVAQACANPYLALAATAIAAAPGDAGSDPTPPATYEEAIDRLARAAWAVDWLGEMFVHDTVELARREAAMRSEATGGRAQATDWDVARYGEVG